MQKRLRKRRRSAKPVAGNAGDRPHRGVKWIVGSVVALGLLVCFAVSLSPKDNPSTEESRPPQEEITAFRPPERLYQTVDPNSSAGRETLLAAQAKLIAEMESEALALVKHVMTMFPHDENADMLQADIYQGLGEDALSLAAWTRALAKNPKRSDIYEKLGEVAAAQGNQEQAIAYWNRGLQTNAKTPNLRWHIANLYLQRGEPAPAADLLIQECTLAPPAARNYFLLGQCQRQLQQLEQAALNYQKAAEISPDYYNAYYGLANVYRTMQDNDRAKQALEKFRAVKQKVDASEDRQIAVEEITQTRRKLAAYYIKAYQLYTRHQKTRQGGPLLERAVAVAPDWALCLEKLAAHYYPIKRFADAIKLYLKAQRLDPNQPMYVVNIGTLYRQLRQYDRAEKAFKQTIDRFPNYSPGYRELVNLNLKTGKHLKETLSLAQRAVQLKGSADHYYTLSKAYQVNGNVQLALSTIERAIRLDPNNAKYRNFDAIIRRRPPKR